MRIPEGAGPHTEQSREPIVVQQHHQSTHNPLSDRVILTKICIVVPIYRLRQLELYSDGATDSTVVVKEIA